MNHSKSDPCILDPLNLTQVQAFICASAKISISSTFH